MDTAPAKRDIFYRIYQFGQQRIVKHIAFWLLLYVILVLIDDNTFGLYFSMSMNFINLIFYIIIVYFNLYYLIPNYLTQRTFVMYCILLIVSVIVLTPIKTMILYFLFSYSPSYQEYVIFNQHYIFLLTLMIAGSSTLAKIVSDWLKIQRDKKELQTQQMQSELKFLKSQINPHFLFNTLNSLYALTLKKSEKAPEIVIKLSEMMRYMLYECNERRVPLRKEVNYIRNYLDLEKLRHGNKVDIDFQVSGEISDQQIAPLLFIPFLENSFKHGLHNQLSEGFVHIELALEDHRIHIRIENSKADSRPMPADGKPSGGIGLKNVRRRLDLMYPDHYALKITESPKTYTVHLNLELID